MKAVLSVEPGGPETLIIRDVDKPVLQSDEVLIRVKACGINYPDTLIIEDKYQLLPKRPFTPGGEVSGVIESIGDNVSDLRVGDRVLALVNFGGMAEYVAAKAFQCVPMPDDMPLDEAASLIFTYGTSYHALKQRAGLQAGEKLLVLGAAGGVGLAAVELGCAMGAEVIAGASTEEKVALAVAKGASKGFVYPHGSFDRDASQALARQFKTEVGAAGADVVFDSIGGAYAEASIRCLAWNGRFLVVGFAAGIPHLPLNLPLLKGGSVVGVFWASFTERHVGESAKNNRELVKMYQERKIKPHVTRSFPMEEAGPAIRELSGRRVVGKIVVTVCRDADTSNA